LQIARRGNIPSESDTFLQLLSLSVGAEGFMPAYSLSSLSEHSTLVDLLTFQASQPGQSPDNPVFTFLETGDGAGETLTFASLDRRARSIAAHLRESARPGDRILLVYPPGLEFIAAFWGCIYAGAVAVPALPAANARTLPRLHAIVTDAQPNMALVSASVAGRMGRASRETGGPLRAISWLVTDDLPDASAHWQRPDLSPDHLAFLQYTSGSTGLPKGVMVSHGNVLANLEVLERAFGVKGGDTFVSWLPHYHDMGLIWGILSPLYTGCHCVQFPSSSFLARPYRWLKLISDYRARMTIAPNFAYELCIAKVGDELKASLDLSSLEVAANGAEPIRADTLRRFSVAFAECGFRMQSFCPGYGLAEATLVVSVKPTYGDGKPATLKLSKTALADNRAELAQEGQEGEDAEDALEAVSTGPVGAKHHALIADPVSLTRRSEREVGEVWLCGPSIARGYWNRREETIRTFAARAEGDDRPYLRTGDLGFLHQNELYIVGRLKEMMIFHGRNIYPQDVEAAVERIDSAFRAHGCAVFSLDEGGSTQLVVLQELEFRAEPDWEGLANRIRAAIAEEFEIYDVAAIVLVKAGRIPHTTSGKIQRLQCKVLFEERALDAVWEWRTEEPGQDSVSSVPRRRPGTETERALALLWRDILQLHVTELAANDNFFELGGQSILATLLLSRIRDAFRVEVDVRVLFDAPTLEGLAVRIDAARIDALRRVSLDRPLSDVLLQAARQKSNRDCPLPLSYAQEGIWLSAQTGDKDNEASYHIAFYVRLVGELDIQALVQTLNAIVQRHEALRTRFVSIDGTPFQIIAPGIETRLEVPVLDWSGTPAEERLERTACLIEEMVQTPFDLTSGPMLRASIVKFEPREHLLLIDVHHIVSDGWSMGVLLREISALYTASVKGLASSLSELPVQYADYGQWQREWLESGALQQQLEYWKGQLQGAPALLELPTDYRRPLIQGFGGAQVPFTVSGNTVRALDVLAHEERATLFMAVAAGFAALLWRYSGQNEDDDDICIGTVVANRGRSETEPLIGCFVNTLVLRTRLGANALFLDLLEQVRATALEAFANQDAPFELVVQAINPERHPSHSPLFQTMLVFQNAPLSNLDLPGLTAQLERPASRTCRFDLKLEVAVDDVGQLQGRFEYNTGLFAAGTIARMVDCFKRLLEAVVEAPEAVVSELPILSEAEREQVLYGRNRTEREYPSDRCIHELFEEQADRTPGATAVEYEGTSLSYGKLNGQANRLAHYLRGLGVAPGERVALCVERGLEMMVGLLGVLKSGGAYVPLDPEYPVERLRFMLEDSAPVALLTQAHLPEGFGGGQWLPPVVDLCGDNGLWEQMPESNLSASEPGLAAGHLAYVIYTSGSTGLPKGVMVEHRSICNYLRWAQDSYYGGVGNGSPAVHSVGFDGLLTTLFCPILAGEKLTLLPAGGEIEALAEHSRTGEAPYTLLKLTPSHLRLLNQAMDGAGGAAPAQRLMIGGEPIVAADVAWWQQRFPEVKLSNHFGPTETTVGSCSFEIMETITASTAVPIGKPVANTRIYILDGAGEPVPTGVTGELYIGGAGVARGYLNRPELTAERFVADPFAPELGARMYKTGDLGRWLADGNIEFLGRNDFQVKIRGFRIELGEIEARLREHAGVGEAVVVARQDEDEPGDKRLVAYYTVSEEVSVEGLRTHLLTKLPEYMVPSGWVQLDALPLTPNGKLDRKALPAPAAQSYTGRGYEEPQGELEGQIAQIWAEILKLERVGRHDNFFELGGHSLLAVRMMSRLRQVNGREVEIRDLFAHPVLRDLASALGGAARAEQEVIPRADRSGTMPLSFAQQRLWFLAQMEGVSRAYHIPGGLRLAGPLDRGALRRALNRIVERHEALRTTVQLVDGEPVQRIAGIEESNFALIEQDLRGHEEAGGELERIVREEANAEFDLERGPLIRGRLIRLADEGDEERNALLLTMHHIVSDGWSMGVMAEELSVLYGAYREGKKDPLPELGIQYGDYAVWQRGRVEGELLRRQAQYWKGALAGAPAMLELPTDRPRPKQQDYAGGMVEVVLDEELTAGLKGLSQRRGVTLYMTLLAGWAVVLSRLSGQREVVIGTPTANRGHVQVEGLIGFFVNTLALRVNLEGPPTGEELLERVKAQVVGAQSNQDIPFEQVVELIQPVRSMAHSPVFQVMFAWQNTPPAQLGLAGVQVMPLRGEALNNAAGGANVEAMGAKFDLGLGLREEDGKIVGGFTYATALYERGTMERHAEYFRNLLGGLAADASAGVEQLPMLPAAERERVLYGWNRTEAEYPRDRCIHELFEEQAERTPEARAVVYEGTSLSYGELNRRANRLAHYLRELGVGPDERVAVCVERGLEMMVGLLGVLKSGGAYVPLDPEYPKERLRFMLEDSAPVALLTQANLRGLFADQEFTVPVIDLEQTNHWENLSEVNPDRLAGLTARHAAYVIYTSGSSGAPKGVVVEHQSVVNLLNWTQSAYPLNEDGAVLQNAPIGFDASVTGFFWPLMTGARVVMARPEGHKDAAYLCQTIRNHGVTAIGFPISMLPVFAEQSESRECTTLAHVMCGGEALPGWVVRQFQERLPHVALHNLYGPTEATVASTAWTGSGNTDDELNIIPIGNPIANTQIYILDGAGEPVPAGVTGELYIGGAGVARGYLNRPELTAELFVADPFAQEPGARMYKTGDLGRWLADGNIDFLGRNDFQVKIRGFRIELGEIEARLREHAEVREAVVEARQDDEPGYKRLVAYYTASQAGEEVSVEGLRAHLLTKLPEYMVPSMWVQLDGLPLTPHGKLDRKALPAPAAQSYAVREYEAPQGEVETQIAGIWAEILRLEQVGRHDNFFELGGHSLLAVRLIERLRRSSLRADVRTLFTMPTVAGLAAAIEDTYMAREVDVPANRIPAGCDAILPEMLPLIQLTEQDIARIVEHVPGGAGNVQDIYPLSPLQSGILFHHLAAEKSDPYLCALLLGFDSRARVDAYLGALEAVIRRHDILRTAVLWEELPEPVQVVWRKAPLPVEEVKLDTVAGEAGKELYARHLRQQRMDVRQAPMQRATIAADGESGRWVLLLRNHHLVSDHTTVEVVHQEIEACLRGEMERLAAPLPFRNLVAQARLGSEAEHENFFRQMLGDVEEPTAPYGLLRVRGDGSGIEAARLELRPELSKRMRAQARRLGVSAASVCHQAWAQVLARLTGSEKVVFGTVLLGRMQGGPGSDRALGMFMNTLPVRIEVGQRAEESVRQTHALLGRLIEHEHAPLALVQRCSEVVAPLPLFTTLLNYRHSARSITTTAWDGVEVLQVDERTNYPLTLSVDDLGDGFRLTVHVDESVEGARICGYMERALRSLVEALEEAPGIPVGILDMLPEAEREQVLYGWNRTEAEYPRDRCIHELFEEQAERTPAATAVVYEGASLSYRELNQQANRLAHYLSKQGVGPDERVALCVERGKEMLVGLLAVLKAGGAYVPLDPDYPEERLRFMLKDSTPVALLTQAHLLERFGDGESLPPVVDLCADNGLWEQRPESNLSSAEIGLRPGHLAYVIYTSGSTGTPKGVMMSQRALVNLLHWQGNALAGVHKILQFAALGFDVAAQEMFTTLCMGKCLVLISTEQRRDADRTLGCVQEEEIETLFLPFVALHHLAETRIDAQAMPSPLKDVITAGEQLQLSGAIRNFIRNSPGCRLHNQYGPTETHVATSLTMTGDPDSWPVLPPIGRPIANTQIYILDVAGEPAPVGITGEIFIGGAGLARGYLNRPELTAERLVADPFAQDPGARMYKTGDLGRWRTDGNVEFLGRNDFQVKIRGFRIELGEVEARLMEHARVREAVVMAREDEPGDKRLVAYYTASQASEEVSVEGLRAHLLAKLPDYMVPSGWVQLDALPLTPNGKLDRKALPAPAAQCYAGRGYEEPQGELESQIAQIWAEILKLDRVGRHDNFFELGGHSLLAVRLTSRLRQYFDVDVPINEVFVRPILSSLADYVLDKQLELYDPACLSEALEYMDSSQARNEEGGE
jgi:amino acid adenylation domain-containing protein